MIPAMPHMMFGKLLRWAALVTTVRAGSSHITFEFGKANEWPARLIGPSGEFGVFMLLFLQNTK
jgi:hypothetical protein